uniref:Secreted protein n=1 Tax=Solanum lycopersicum TaxID=4081 RepID=K4CS21_SOLLC
MLLFFFFLLDSTSLFLHLGLLDADWPKTMPFSTSSTDGIIYVCKVGECRPVKTFSRHQACSNDGIIYIFFFISLMCYRLTRRHRK